LHFKNGRLNHSPIHRRQAFRTLLDVRSNQLNLL